MDATTPLDHEVYDLLRGIAGSLMRGRGPGGPGAATLQPTAVVHEAWMKLDRAGEGQTGQLGEPAPTGTTRPKEGIAPARFKSRGHFVATAARAMRQILINHAEHRQAARRGGGRQRVTIDTSVADVGGPARLDVLELEEALRALEALDPRQAQVVELRYFGGMGVDEIAAYLDVSPRTVQLDWRMARSWLRLRLATDEGDDEANERAEDAADGR
ncbi:MAG: ECF-type sigma factor [Phycisphaerales bacterium]